MDDHRRHGHGSFRTRLKGLAWGGFLALISGAASAQWVEDLTNDKTYFYAAVDNQDGHLLGQWCSAAVEPQCKWVVVMDVDCPDSKAAPALLSGKPGGASVVLHCDGAFTMLGKRVSRFAIAPFDDVDTVMRSGGMVGLAFPLASGKFQVLRFEIGDGIAVVDRMRAKAIANGKKSTHSEKL